MYIKEYIVRMEMTQRIHFWHQLQYFWENCKKKSLFDQKINFLALLVKIFKIKALIKQMTPSWTFVLRWFSCNFSICNSKLHVVGCPIFSPKSGFLPFSQKNRNFQQTLMPKMDSLSHFHSRNVYFYIHYS